MVNVLDIATESKQDEILTKIQNGGGFNKDSLYASHGGTITSGSVVNLLNITGSVSVNYFHFIPNNANIKANLIIDGVVKELINPSTSSFTFTLLSIKAENSLIIELINTATTNQSANCFVSYNLEV